MSLKKIKPWLCLFTCILVLTGCENAKEEVMDNAVNMEKESDIETEILLSNTEEERIVSAEKNLEEKYKNIFAEFKNLNFSFLSGAGGWSTEMTIDEDGTFRGIYYDSDMGSASESYPNGTLYYCSFQGKFTQAVQKEDYIYSTTIESISYDNPVGTEEIKEGIRYIYSDAYGLDNPKEILIYLPGMPIKDLPEGYLSWVRTNWRMDYEFTINNTELPFYGLYNVNSEQGFSSYSIIDDLGQSLEYREKEAVALEEAMLHDPNLTQADLNEKSYRLYQIWDITLNEIWEILRRNLSAEEMSALTEEQLEWITMKEQSMKEAGKEVEGGSMYGMVVNQRGAKLTKERSYVLLEMVGKIKK